MGAATLNIASIPFRRAPHDPADQFSAAPAEKPGLSQTLYLVSTDLGLGAFVTAAINNVNIDETLGLDGFTEAAIAINGCGKVAREKPVGANSSDLEPEYLPYQARA